MGNPLIDILALLLVLVAIVVIAGLLRSSGGPYDRIGAGGMSVSEDEAGPPEDHELARRRDRDDEIRQMLQARSERLQRSGMPAIDIEAELRRLLAGGEGSSADGADEIGGQAAGSASTEPAHRHDPELLAEVRELVAARNARRVRAGQAPLDVESEVARRLSELGD